MSFAGLAKSRQLSSHNLHDDVYREFNKKKFFCLGQAGAVQALALKKQRKKSRIRILVGETDVFNMNYMRLLLECTCPNTQMELKVSEDGLIDSLSKNKYDLLIIGSGMSHGWSTSLMDCIKTQHASLPVIAMYDDTKYLTSHFLREFIFQGLGAAINLDDSGAFELNCAIRLAQIKQTTRKILALEQKQPQRSGNFSAVPA